MVASCRRRVATDCRRKPRPVQLEGIELEEVAQGLIVCGSNGCARMVHISRISSSIRLVGQKQLGHWQVRTCDTTEELTVAATEQEDATVDRCSCRILARRGGRARVVRCEAGP